MDGSSLPKDAAGPSRKEIGSKPSPTEIIPDYRQQRKIIKALLSEDLRIPPEADVQIEFEEQDEVLRRMADGGIGKEQFKKVLLSMESPFKSADGLENIDALIPVVFSNEKMRAIVAGVSKGVMDSRLELTPADFETLITQFPDPIELEELFNQHADYIPKDSLRDFMKIVYGKRFEYWQQIKLLQEEAMRKYGAKESDKTPKIESVDSDQALLILQRLEVRGSEFKGRKLTKDILIEQGLLPAHKVNIQGVDTWFSSNAYHAPLERTAIVAYIPDGNKIAPRTYYLSNSAGLWRYLPDYALDPEGSGNASWFGKGYGETSITLPIETQMVLAQLTQEGTPIVDVSDPDLIFAGPARSVADRNNRRNSFYREVKPSSKLPANQYPDKTMVEPGQLGFSNPNYAPNFSNRIDSWQQTTSLYGNITIEIFESQDRSLKYMFCKDAQGRAWIGGIEDATAPITSQGLKEYYIDGGDLQTPAFEYSEQAKGYGNSAIRNGHYVDMFENYLKHVPVIQQYLKRPSGH